MPAQMADVGCDANFYFIFSKDSGYRERRGHDAIDNQELPAGRHSRVQPVGARGGRGGHELLAVDRAEAGCARHHASSGLVGRGSHGARSVWKT